MRGRMIGTPAWGSRYRSTSVPAEHLRYERSSVPDIEGARRANLIANLAAEDSDAIASASRRHDRDFLHDISAKLANIGTVHAGPLLPGTTLPPPPPSALLLPPRVVRKRPIASTTSYVPSSTGGHPRRSAGWTSDDDYDVAAFLQRTPSTYVPSSVARGSSHHVRSASVPPLTARPSVPRWFPTSPYYYGRRGGNYVPSVLPVGLPPVPTADRMDAITDGVVGVAHTALYGDIVIGIPYKKRYMFNVQHGVDDYDTQSLPAMHLEVPSRVSTTSATAAHFAQPHHSVGLLAAPVGNLSKPYTRASYAGPPTVYSDVTRNNYRRAPALARTQHINGPKTNELLYQDFDDSFSTFGYPYVTSKSASRKNYDLENEIAGSIFGDGYNDRISTLSKDYKNVLSRYNMPSNGPRTVSLPDNELDRKYSHILASMQPKMSSSSHYAPPPVRATDFTHSASLPPPGINMKPPRPVMSDTRRKLRDLLCRSRNDPRYFDD